MNIFNYSSLFIVMYWNIVKSTFIHFTHSFIHLHLHHQSLAFALPHIDVHSLRLWRRKGCTTTPPPPLCLQQTSNPSIVSSKSFSSACQQLICNVTTHQFIHLIKTRKGSYGIRSKATLSEQCAICMHLFVVYLMRFSANSSSLNRFWGNSSRHATSKP